MKKRGTEVEVAELPRCSIHQDKYAHYDFFSRRLRTWLYGCEPCFRDHGGRLGLGMGQRLVVKPKQ
jgi:hypothetical protein